MKFQSAVGLQSSIFTPTDQPAYTVVEPLWNESNCGLNRESREEGRFTQNDKQIDV